MTSTTRPTGGQGERSAWPVLLSYARPYWGALVGGGILSLATAATGLALPLVVRELIGALGAGGTVTGLLVLMTVLVAANAAIGAVGGYVLERAGESVVLTARRGLIGRLIRLRLSAVENAEPGDLMSRVTADTTPPETTIHSKPAASTQSTDAHDLTVETRRAGYKGARGGMSHERHLLQGS
jgi:ABC-type multidrug transport system fused ATPase/permease subunit